MAPAKKTTAAKKTPAAAPADTESARTEALAADTDAPADEQSDQLAAGAQAGSVVRLNDPDDDDQGPDRFALVVGDQLIVDLPGVRGYQLPVYPAS
jgi:hypothetical protein